MESSESLLKVVKVLFGLKRVSLNNVDEASLLEHVSKYIDYISRDDNQDVINNVIEELKILTTNFTGEDVDNPSNEIKGKGQLRNDLTDEKLLRVHLKLMKDVAARRILSGRTFYDSDLRNNHKGLTKFQWSYYPYDVQDFIFENLNTPERAGLRHPTDMDTYRQFHAFLYYEEATIIFRHRRFDLRGITLEVRDDDYFFLKVFRDYNLKYKVGDRVILRSPRHTYYLGAFIHKTEDEGYYLQFDEKIHKEGLEGLEFDIFFVPSLARVLCGRRHRAIKYMSDYPLSDTILFPFPKPENDIGAPKINVDADELEWFDNRLDTKQRKAVIQILRSEARPAPYVVTGPPGSGKTTTMIEAIFQVYKRDNNAKILVCNPVIDEDVALRILKANIIPTREIWRLAAAHRLDEEMSSDLAEVSKISSAVTPEMFKNYRLVISTCYQADRLRVLRDEFDYLFICNASMLDEPQSLIAIRNLKPDGCLVLAGDPFTGEPTCSSAVTKMEGFDISLLERLLCRPSYQSRHHPGGELLHDWRYRAILLTNYRSDSRLMKPSNSAFYANTMVCEIKTPDWLLEFMGSENPLLFHPVDAMTSESFQDCTWNPKEIIVCMSYVERLIAAGLEPKQIGIVAPFEDQEYRMKMVCEIDRLKDIDIWTKSPPGVEKEVIIITAVESVLKEYVKMNENEFNLAIGRAKWMVILVGNKKYLSDHSFGSKYLEHAHEVTFKI